MKKNKIVNKIGILVLAVMLSILSSITVLASEPEEAELGPRQDISKNLTTGEITVNEIPANLNKNSSDVMEPFIPVGIVAGVVGIISVIVGVALKMNNNAIAIIGGVDGPTSVFVAGKLNSVLVSILLIAIGVVMLIVAIIFYFLKKK